MAGRQRAKGAQEVGDGAAAGGEKSGQGQEDEAFKGRGEEAGARGSSTAATGVGRIMVVRPGAIARERVCYSHAPHRDEPPKLHQSSPETVAALGRRPTHGRKDRLPIC
jgi:hypothetical protein